MTMDEVVVGLEETVKVETEGAPSIWNSRIWTKPFSRSLEA